MAYVVLARKYRPQQFEDMVGQEHISRTLGNALGSGRVHHAYLFAGARGLGKTTSARILAKGLVCEQGPTARPCNACSQCVAINEGRSVDVMEIDGASNNSVDNIRNLREQVHYLPQTARRKVYIIDEVHMLTTQAFNALLKTLEEPPAHVNFIFATTEPHKVLPTILSRVSRLDFRSVPDEQLVAHLQGILQREGVIADDDGLRLVARASGGSVRDSLTLLDQVIAFCDPAKPISEPQVREILGLAERVAVAELVAAVLAHDSDATLLQFEALMVAGYDLVALCVQIIEYLRDLVLAKSCSRTTASGPTFGGLTTSEYERLQAQVADVDATTLAQLFDRFTRVVDRLPQSRVPRLLVEVGLLELANSGPLIDVAEAIDELNRIAGGGSSSSGGSFGQAAGGSKPGTRARPPARRGSTAPVANGATARDAASPFEVSEPTNGATARDAASPFEVSEPTNGATPVGAASPIEFSEPVRAGESELAQGLWNMVASRGLFKPSDDVASAQTVPTNGSTPAPALAEDHRKSCTLPSSAQPRQVIDVDALPNFKTSFEAWEQLVARIREDDEYVSAVLTEVGLVAMSDGLATIVAPRGSFAHTELTTRPDIRAVVEQASRDHFGREYKIELQEGEPVLPERPSVGLVAAERRRQLKEAVETEAHQDARIQAVIRMFDGHIATTKPLERRSGE